MIKNRKDRIHHVFIQSMADPCLTFKKAAYDRNLKRNKTKKHVDNRQRKKKHRKKLSKVQ